MSTNRKGPSSFPASLTSACALALALAGCGGEENRAPTAAAASLVGDEDTDIVGRLSGADRDGDSLTFNVVRLPDHGTLAVEAGGSFKYTPLVNYNGGDSFEFYVSDGQKSSASATVSIAVTAVNDAPTIEAPTALALDEDASATASFTIADIDGEPAEFKMKTQPAHGEVRLVGANTLEYRPQPNFNGQDTFEISASDGHADAAPLLITAKVAAVNDPLVLGFIADETNSAETFTTRVTLPLEDVDGDLASVTASSDRTDIASVTYDPSAKQLVLTPVEYGLAHVTVTATDGTAPVSRSFDFSVQDVTKARTFTSAAQLVPTSAISVRNDSDRDVDFVLEHDGFPVFESIAKMVQFVRDMPAELPDEPFERKLWRFIRDSSNHYYPLMPLQFQEAPWGTINSTGFGFCADMATSYVAIARAAGYEARVWSLYNHVVPEIKVDGRWQLYDPDVAIYYFNRSGAVAGVEELAADPQLIRAPTRPILPVDLYQYSEVVADFYATTANNAVATNILLPSVKDVAGRFHLPPGATLTYPGRWTEAVAYEVFGSLIDEADLPDWRSLAAAQGMDTPIPLPFQRQAKMDLPEGWTGSLALPLWLWEIQGSGSVRIDGMDYAIGSAELTERLQRRRPARELEIIQGSNVSLIMQMNFVMFYMQESTAIELTGRDVWALTTTLVDMGAQGAGEHWTMARIRAVP